MAKYLIAVEVEADSQDEIDMATEGLLTIELDTISLDGATYKFDATLVTTKRI